MMMPTGLPRTASRGLPLANLAYVSLLLCGLSACETVKRDLPQAAVALPSPSPVPPPYLVQPGDILESRYVINPLLNEQSLVTPAGRVSFRYASDLPAAGHTLPQVRQEVATTAGITERGFDIVLRSSVGTRVYVTGEVTTPGEILVNGDITALQAVSRAGGFKLGAQDREVVLVRRGPDKRPTLYAMNLKAATNGIAPEDDVPLRTYDIVYVPRDRAGNLSLIFERLRNAIPFNFSVFYGDTTATQLVK